MDAAIKSTATKYFPWFAFGECFREKTLVCSQVVVLQFVRGQLFSSGLSNDEKPIPSERTGAEREPTAGHRRYVTLCFSINSIL